MCRQPFSALKVVDVLFYKHEFQKTLCIYNSANASAVGEPMNNPSIRTLIRSGKS